MQDLPERDSDPLFDEFGDYKLTHQVTEAMIDSNLLETKVIEYEDVLMLHNQNEKPGKIDYSQYRSK